MRKLVGHRSGLLAGLLLRGLLANGLSNRVSAAEVDDRRIRSGNIIYTLIFVVALIIGNLLIAVYFNQVGPVTTNLRYPFGMGIQL